MNKKNTITLLFITVFLHSIFAQLTLGNDKHVLEISGAASTFLNLRILKPGETDNSKNMFALRDAIIQFEGKHANLFQYEFQFNLASLIPGSSSNENGVIMDAWFQMNAPKYFNARLGYGKLPYSRSNLTPHTSSPFFNRSEIARGMVFNQRDVGLTLNGNFYKQLINVYAGVYNGMGEAGLGAKNDKLGSFEYLARVDFSYPIKNRYTEADMQHYSFPVMCLGLNARYVEKSSTIIDDYSVAVIAGKKWTYGGDFSIKYKGFALQAEMQQLRINPMDKSRLQNLQTTFFRTGGFYVQGLYYIKPAKTLIALRYDELNESDLVVGKQRHLTAAINYMPFGSKLMFRVNYTRMLSEEMLINKWTDQFRIGAQYLFQ